MASGAGLIERLIAVGRPDLAERLKHLAGQHPQQRHGYRFGKNMTLAQARRQRERGNWRDYKHRARLHRVEEMKDAKFRAAQAKIRDARRGLADDISGVAAVITTHKEKWAVAQHHLSEFANTAAALGKAQMELAGARQRGDAGLATLEENFKKLEARRAQLNVLAQQKVQEAVAFEEANRQIIENGEKKATFRYIVKLPFLNKEIDTAMQTLRKEGEVVRRQIVERGKIVDMTVEGRDMVKQSRLSEIRLGRGKGILEDDADRWQEMATFVGEMAGKNPLLEIGGTQPTAVLLGGEDRPYYSPQDNSVHLSPIYTSQKSVAHELGHWVEQRDPLIRYLATAWRDGRAANERAVSMRDATGASYYRDGETTRPDDFFHPYVGKFYADGSTEVISMGIEAMFENAEKLAIQDPDMFNFIYAVLRLGQ